MGVTMENGIVSAILLAQEKGEPEKIYKKAIVGRVIAKVIDPFSGSRTEVMVEGDPAKTDPSELEISLWTPFEVKYFEQANKGLIEKGSLVRVDKRSEYKVDYSNALSDEELQAVIMSPFFSMRKSLQQITSETTLQRLIDKAKELNRSSKTITEIELRLEEVQQS